MILSGIGKAFVCINWLVAVIVVLVHKKETARSFCPEPYNNLLVSAKHKYT